MSSGTSTHVDAGLYLPKRDYNFFVDDVTSLPLDTTTIGILHLSEHPVFPCDVTQYEITPNASGSVRLRLDAKRIELRVEPDSLPGTISSAKGFSFEIRLVCKDADHESLQPYYEPLTRAKVSLRSIPPGLAKLKALDPSSVGNGAPFSGTDVMEEILDAIRPRGGHLGYDLVENTSEGSILDVLDLGSWLGDIASVELNVLADEGFKTLRQARAPEAGLEPETGRVRYPLCLHASTRRNRAV
ncbi:hypothetical protein PoB_002885600 [Plakobranchus ocellatus]|uniref:Cadherin domain-containing protein n=1 Tax=Plakobranchus ocellatus TaxID=259542 RepID=A0AAV3ZTM8_9GAST|nr:hypothetical protein PoB_002885600 [Plakobranchus ocellatus]